MTSDYDDVSRIEHLSRAELITDIGENARTLIGALEIAREPDSHISRMQFDLSERRIPLPPAFNALIDETSRFDSVSVDFEQSTEASSIGIVMEVDRFDDTPTTILINWDNGGFVTQILIGSDHEPLETIEQPSKEDVAQFLASLFAPSKTGDYGAFSSMDLTSPHVLNRLEDVLAKHADDVIATGIFLIDSNDGRHQIEYSKENDEIKFVTLTRASTGNRATMTLCFDSYQFDGTYDLANLEGVRIYSEDTSKVGSEEVDCTTERIVFFDDFTKELKQLLSSGKEIASSDLDSINPDPSSGYTGTSGKSLRSKREFTDELDQDGFDSPDASA